MRKASFPRCFDTRFFPTDPPIPKDSPLGRAILEQPYALLSQQGDREEWLKSRLHRITGSAWYKLLSRKTDSKEELMKRRQSCFRVMSGDPEAYNEGIPEKGTYARSMIDFGTNFEPDARVICETLVDRDIMELGFWLDKKRPWMGASVDGVDVNLTCIYEFKCRGPGNKPPHKAPMPYHYDQMQWNMAVTKTDRCEFVSASKLGHMHETVFADPFRQAYLIAESHKIMQEYFAWMADAGRMDEIPAHIISGVREWQR